MTAFDWSQFTGGSAVSFNAVGDTAIGDVMRIETREGNGGRPVPVVVIHTDEGEEREIWCSPAHLRSEMARVAPQPGDRLKVTLVELKNIGKPSPMKVFDVRVKRGAAQPLPEPEPAEIYSDEPF